MAIAVTSPMMRRIATCGWRASARFPALGWTALAYAAFLSVCLCAGFWTAAAHAESGFTKGDWPFQPLARPATPSVNNAAWTANAIDRFILSSLEQKGLGPNAPADKATLLRRVTFDLTGLPPKPEEVEAFLDDKSPLAYQRVVDRLLASPRYGERWARHWLDVVRFADTAGFKTDFLREELYRYRDYVIRAMNSDLPYDRFVRQQIAGDQLEPGNPEALIATGFLRLYPQETTAADFVKHRQDILDDVTEVTGLAFLALTVGCAKCHDHKFDPIEQADFFRLEACFSAIVPRDDLPPVTPDVLAAHEKQEDKWEAATADIRRQLDELAAKVEEGVVEEITVAYDPATRIAWKTPESQRTTHQQQLVALSFRYIDNIVRKRIRRLEGDAKAKYDALQKQLAKYDSLKPQELPAAMGVSDGPGPAPPTHVLDAGDYRKPEEPVSAGFPVFLGRSELVSIPMTPAPRIGGPRADLARWLTISDHPLTARVIANRLWQHHFGQGIIASSNDFGAMGDAPSHPALLDWLACELVEKRWSLKALHRLMVLSATYQQSSHVDPAAELHRRAHEVDPGNRLLWHARRQRLDAEAVRDSLYALSGQLDESMYGPSVYFKLPDSLLANSYNAWTPDPSAVNQHRRSIYGFQKRNLRHPLLAAFDQPDLYISCGRRANTLTPTQSLALLNGEEATEQAAAWAGRLLGEAGNDDQFIRRAWLEAYCRPPTAAELTATRKFLADQTDRIVATESIAGSSLPDPCPSCLPPPEAAAYVDLCHALMNSTEFVYRD